MNPDYPMWPGGQCRSDMVCKAIVAGILLLLSVGLLLWS